MFRTSSLLLAACLAISICGARRANASVVYNGTGFVQMTSGNEHDWVNFSVFTVNKKTYLNLWYKDTLGHDCIFANYSSIGMDFTHANIVASGYWNSKISVAK